MRGGRKWEVDYGRWNNEVDYGGGLRRWITEVDYGGGLREVGYGGGSYRMDVRLALTTDPDVVSGDELLYDMH